MVIARVNVSVDAVDFYHAAEVLSIVWRGFGPHSSDDGIFLDAISSRFRIDLLGILANLHELGESDFAVLSASDRGVRCPFCVFGWTFPIRTLAPGPTVFCCTLFSETPDSAERLSNDGQLSLHDQYCWIFLRIFT